MSRGTTVHSVESIRRMIPIVELEDDDQPPPTVSSVCGSSAAGRRRHRRLGHIRTVLCQRVGPLPLLMIAVAGLAVVVVPTAMMMIHSKHRQQEQPPVSSSSSSTVDTMSSSSSPQQAALDLASAGVDPQLLDPPEYPWTMFQDVAEYPIDDTDVPFVWNVPRGGSNVLLDTMAHCYDLTRLQDIGYDTKTVAGLNSARADDALSRPDVEYFSSPHLFEAANTLSSNPQRKGRMIASFRHPHDRELNEFRVHKSRGVEPYKDMTFMEYLRSDYSADNWLTRFLVHKYRGPITGDDLLTAKRILRRKCLVLLMDEEREESIVHVERYFGWSVSDTDPQCTERVRERHKDEEEVKLSPSSEEWKEVNRLNQWDVLLYGYVRELFVIQGYELDMEIPFGDQQFAAGGSGSGGSTNNPSDGMGGATTRTSTTTTEEEEGEGGEGTVPQPPSNPNNVRR